MLNDLQIRFDLPYQCLPMVTLSSKLNKNVLKIITRLKDCFNTEECFHLFFLHEYYD